MDEIRIGDSGWRGIYTDDFSVVTLSAIITALAKLFPRQRVIIGYDTRFLSRELAHHAAFLLNDQEWQVEVVDHPFPTPGIGTLVRYGPYDWGLVLTASHNPYYYNGLKILDTQGALIDRLLADRLQQEANRLVSHLRVRLIPKNFFNRVQSFEDASHFYRKRLFHFIQPKLIQRGRLLAVTDSFGGTTSDLFSPLLKELKIGMKSVLTPNEPTFGKRRLEPDASSLDSLGEAVRKYRARIGLACDVDGDRFSVVDHRGQFVSNNYLGALMVWYLLEVRKERGTVYQTVSCSSLTERICEKYEVPLRIMPVGFQKMGLEMKNDPESLVGIEETGGLAYGPHLPFKDGLMAHLLLLEMLARKGQTVTQLIGSLFKTFGSYYYRRCDLHVASEKETGKWLESSRWEQGVGERAVSQSELDGIKWIFSSGSWILVRRSKTEPLLRIYFESQRQSFLKKVIQLVKRGET